jgi:acyl-CoA synthetase (AMP-forming)/AMP-acid ligase II
VPLVPLPLVVRLVSTRDPNDADVAEVADLLAAHAAANADAPAVLVDATAGAIPSATTFGELNEMVNQLAHGLDALGAVRGDRLVVVYFFYASPIQIGE